MSDTSYHVYLANPGVQHCWGTTTGNINSTAKHIAQPYQGGLGFSGVIDFNILWTDAHNLYEEGKITHFAMLHGDLTPDPSQRWLDILLDEMDATGSVLISAHSPIKDQRGVTSSGICDPTNPWGAFRRFTQHEVVHKLPKTFTAAQVGYPNKPLLHNTGCWVCDLRHPVFHETNDDGTLKLMFRFPERIKRNAAGQWRHEQESEDWYFSRKLWEAGVTNTVITTKVRLTHHGRMDFRNWTDFGTDKEDEDTADRWREERDALPLSLTQLLQFELGTSCNLGDDHTACPNKSLHRYASVDTTTKLDDDTIVDIAAQAYNELGFDGLIGWAYYNEPLCEESRMFRLMERIVEAAPAAKFILWTNGTLIPEDCERYAQFSQIVVSFYNDDSRRGLQRLLDKKISCRKLEDAKLDTRLSPVQPTDPHAPCMRPFVEFVIDTYGNTHLCCYDWRGLATFGNVHTDPFAVIAKRWRDMLPDIAGAKMTDKAPATCRQCGYRWNQYQQHDETIVERCRRWRASLEETHADAS